MKFRYDKETEEIVVTSATRIEYHQVGLWLTRHVKGYRYMPAFKMGVWNGQQSYFKNGRVNLGLWKEAMRGCKEIDASFDLENKEDFPLNRDVTLEKVKNFCNEFFKDHKVKTKDGQWVPFTPYDHQIESAYKILKNRYCMAEVATSGGKSLIISIVMFYTLKNMNPDAKFLIIVPSITLVTQFYDNIVEYNFGINNLVEMRAKNSETILSKTHKPCDVRVEEVMSDRPRKFSGTQNPNVYIGTYQSLEKWPKEFFQQFHTVVTDECLHPDSLVHMADGSFKKISEIKIGDFVKTINEVTKEIENKMVEYVYENLSIDNDMYEIEMEDGRILKITGNHKVYTNDFTWKKVEDLTENDEILDFNFKSLMKIKKIKKIEHSDNVYNLRIEDNHNYFVNNLCVSNCHQAKAKSYLKILGQTFGHAYSRFGVSGTTPSEETCEILTIQSVLGPKITEVSANELKEKGIITPMDIKVVIMNHNDSEFAERINIIKKSGNGKDAFDLEKDYIHISERRLDFIKKIVDKCDSNTLLLFHTIEYGQSIFNKLQKECPGKEFYYIDGEISGKKREVIKKEMENTDGKIKVLCASFGTLSTGVSINAIFNVIFADSFKSEQIIIQSIGRALRLHDDKKKANIFDLVDVYSSGEMSNILFRHFKEREKFYIKRGYPYKITKINL